jgi:FHS family L-fucose permease-like MFS transporter
VEASQPGVRHRRDLHHLIAEIGVGNLFVSFVSRPDIGNMTTRRRAVTDAAAGRDDGRPLRRLGDHAKVPAGAVLAVFSIGAFLTVLVTVFADGHIAMWSLILVGLFHSIMFPTIFTLGIRGLGPLTEKARAC